MKFSFGLDFGLEESPTWFVKCDYCGEHGTFIGDAYLINWIRKHATECSQLTDETEDLRRTFLNENVGHGPFIGGVAE